MASYYQYFASGQEMCLPSFVEYTDAITSKQLYAGCLAMYDRSTQSPSGVGVSCMDLNMIESIDTMKNLSGWRELSCKMSDISKTCRPLELTGCHIEKLRAQVSSESVCGGPVASTCPCVDAACQDSSTFKDEKGYFCDTWIGDNCNEAASRWGYSAGGQASILSMCKRSCGACTWHDPCPYEKAASCSSQASSIPSFCRACETDKVSGVDIEGCLMSCASKGGERICDLVVSGAVRRHQGYGMLGSTSVLGMLLSIAVAAALPVETGHGVSR